MLDEKTGVNGEEIFDGVGGSVSAVQDGESILNVKIRLDAVDNMLNEDWVVVLFAGVEAEVFEEKNIAVFAGADLLGDFCAGNGGDERNVADKVI